MTNAISTALRQLGYYYILHASALLRFKVSIPPRRRTDCVALSWYFRQSAAACFCSGLVAFFLLLAKQKQVQHQRYPKDNAGVQGGRDFFFKYTD